MKKTIVFLIIILSLPALAQEPAFETGPGGEITSGMVPANYEGPIDGAVTLPGEVSFSGEGEFKGGVLTIESGTIGGLNVRDGTWQDGSLRVEHGFIDNVEVTNVEGVKQMVGGGFEGSTSKEGATVENTVIKNKGANFQFRNGKLTIEKGGVVGIVDPNTNQDFRFVGNGEITVDTQGNTLTFSNTEEDYRTGQPNKLKVNNKNYESLSFTPDVGEEITIDFSSSDKMEVEGSFSASVQKDKGLYLAGTSREGKLVVEQDLFVLEGFWEDVNGIMEDGNIRDGVVGFSLADRKFAGELEVKTTSRGKRELSGENYFLNQESKMEMKMSRQNTEMSAKHTALMSHSSELNAYVKEKLKTDPEKFHNGLLYYALTHENQKTPDVISDFVQEYQNNPEKFDFKVADKNMVVVDAANGKAAHILISSDMPMHMPISQGVSLTGKVGIAGGVMSKRMQMEPTPSDMSMGDMQMGGMKDDKMEENMVMPMSKVVIEAGVAYPIYENIKGVTTLETRLPLGKGETELLLNTGTRIPLGRAVGGMFSLTPTAQINPLNIERSEIGLGAGYMSGPFMAHIQPYAVPGEEKAGIGVGAMYSWEKTIGVPVSTGIMGRYDTQGEWMTMAGLSVPFEIPLTK